MRIDGIKKGIFLLSIERVCIIKKILRNLKIRKSDI